MLPNQQALPRLPRVNPFIMLAPKWFLFLEKAYTFDAPVVHQHAKCLPKVKGVMPHFGRVTLFTLGKHLDASCAIKEFPWRYNMCWTYFQYSSSRYRSALSVPASPEKSTKKSLALLERHLSNIWGRLEWFCRVHSINMTKNYWNFPIMLHYVLRDVTSGSR